MGKRPDVTLPPSKGIITEVAGRIYAAYVVSGRVKEEEEDRWIRHSIRAAIAIARMVDKSVKSDDELPAEKPLVHHPEPVETLDSRGEQTGRSKASLNDSDVEELAEEVLLGHATPPPKDRAQRAKSAAGGKNRGPGASPEAQGNAALAAHETLQGLR